MKKFFSFVIALVACAMTFTSCEKKIDSPLVGSWLHRGYYIDLEEHEYNALISFHFFDNGDFQYNISLLPDEGTVVHDAYEYFGSWDVDGDKLTLHYKKYGKSHDGQVTYDSTFKPYDEEAKWRIENHYLYLTRYIGTEEEVVEEFYDGSLKND